MPDGIHPAPELAGHASVRLRRRGLVARLAQKCKVGGGCGDKASWQGEAVRTVAPELVSHEQKEDE